MLVGRFIRVRLQILDAQFAVGGNDGENLASGEALERTAFIRLQMCRCGGYDRFVRLEQATQRHDVRTRSVESKVRIGARAEDFAKTLDRIASVRIVSVRGGIPLVGLFDCVKDLKRDGRVIIAGKSTHSP